MTKPIENDVVLAVQDVHKSFPVKRQLGDIITRQPAVSVQAVSGISFQIERGETFGLVGESGCGKTTTGRLAAGLLEPTQGEIYFHGQRLDVNKRSLRRQIQVVFQDPLTSLNPRMMLGAGVGHGLKIHNLVESEDEFRHRVETTFERVGLTPGYSYFDRYPHQLSGGEQQRAVIARAIIMEPEFILADEPVAMADVSVRAILLELLKDLQEELGLTYLFITHDLATAKYICDRIGIMYLGKIVETGTIDDVFKSPLHPYTEALLAAIPSTDPRLRREISISVGEVPSALNPPSGCHFHPRCPIAQDVCKTDVPELRFLPNETDHGAACHLRTGDYTHLESLRAVN